jgi:hypothetical protein
MPGAAGEMSRQAKRLSGNVEQFIIGVMAA